MIKLKAKEILPFDTEPKVRLGRSTIKKNNNKINKNSKNTKRKNYGLFAIRNIEKDEPIVIYWGKPISDNEVYYLYTENRKEYQKIFPYIRNNEGGSAINGKVSLKEPNPNLWGVYVNDISIISPEFLNNKNRLIDNIITYLRTDLKCNLYVKNTDDFPVYCAKRKIYKGEELFIHYGMGYWLNHYNFKPEEIYDINQKIKETIK